MRISTKGLYALRLLLDLAEHPDDGYVALKDVAERQNISKKYLEQIVPILSKSGLLKTERGSQGGYQLSKAPEKYTVGEVLRLTECTLSPVQCVEEDSDFCSRSEDCAMLPVWQGLNKVVNDYLDSVTLQSIMESHKNRDLSDCRL